MNITNKLDLPKPFEDAVTKEYQYKDKRYSVTEINKGYKEIILTRRHDEEIEQDVADMIWLIFGTAIHKVLEDSQEAEDELKENKIHFTFPSGYTLSGQFDLYSESLKKVTDYKSGSIWKVIFDEWDDYRTQCLDYALLLRKIGFECDKGENVMLLKDWSATKAKTEANYPPLPVFVKKYEFTDQEIEQEEERLAVRFNALDHFNTLKDDEIPECTPEERWAEPTKYAVMKEGRKTAVKLFENADEALEYAEQLGAKHYVVERPGKDKKCLDYCNCCKWCHYYKEHYGSDEEAEDTAES